MVIIDTNVIIDHLRRKDRTDSVLSQISRKEGVGNLALSTITIQELYEGSSTKNKIKEELLLETISPLAAVTYTYKIAQYAGEMMRDLKITISFADAAIASTAILHDSSLFTLNEKHFQTIPRLKLYYL